MGPLAIHVRAPTSLRERATLSGLAGLGHDFGTWISSGNPAEACRGLVRTCAALQRRDVPNRPKPIVALLTFLPSASSHPPPNLDCPTPDCRTEYAASIASVTSTQNSDYWTGLPFWDSWPVLRTWAIQLKYPPILLPLASPRFCSTC